MYSYRQALEPLVPRKAYRRSSTPKPVLIVVPLYRRRDLAIQIIESLAACAEDIREIQGEVLFINDSPDDSDLCDTLQAELKTAKEAFPCRLLVNAQNLGFVQSCNMAFDEAIEREMDLLLLNSDVVITSGALTEMVRISRTDPMIGFVNPRSNNATLATLPFQDRFRRQPVEEAKRAWSRLATYLPRMSYVPTAVGFCMLIRWVVMVEFGSFDEIYGAGYNEENDLVMRAGRRGYRAVLANYAYVWHEGGASFALKSEAVNMEVRNRAILLARYPEYEDLTHVYFGSPEQRAEYLLGAILPETDGLLSVALDFSSFAPAHNGTTVAGAQILASAAERWKDWCRLYVLCSESAYDFHNYAQYGVERRDPHGGDVYAAVFRVGQPFDWSVMERLMWNAATIGVFMLDTIAIDSSQLYSPRLHGMWSFTLDHVDLVATTSELTNAQLDRRFSSGSALRLQSLHSLDLADYRLPTSGAPRASTEGHVFVVGNHFWHKDVATAVNALAKAFPHRQIKVLAGDREDGLAIDRGVYAPRGLEANSNVLRLEAGTLTPWEMGDLYSHASLIVFPSHYEGFGMPLLNALAARKPVFIRPLPVFEEMEEVLGGDPNIHLFHTTGDLVEALQSPPGWIDQGASRGRPGDASRAADDIRGAIASMIEHVSYDRIVRRIRAIQTLNDFANIKSEEVAASIRAEAAAEAATTAEAVTAAAKKAAADAAPKTREAFAARYLAQRVETAARQVLRIRGLLALMRLGLRTLRAGRRLLAPRRLG